VAEPPPSREPTILGYCWPYRRNFAVGVLFLLATNAAEKAVPWFLRDAIDALNERRLPDVREAALTVVGLALVMWVVRTLSRIWIFNVGRDVEYDLRNDFLANVHRLGPSFFSRLPTGEIMSRATNDLAQIRLFVGFAGLNVINSSIAVVAAVALMLTISPRLTFYALLPFPLLILTTRMFGSAIYGRSRANQEALAGLADRANENVAGIRVVRAMGLEDRERERFEEANQRALRTTMGLVTLRGLMWPVLMGFSSLGTLMVVWIGGHMVLEGEMTPGDFAAFNGYLGLLVWPTLAFGYILSVVQRGRASFERIKEVLTATPDVVEAPGAPAPDGPGALEVRGLAFTHRGAEAPCLSDVDLRVEAGRSLAIVGQTGAGKSTLAALLPRLLPTPKATVFLDGEDVVELQLAGLRAAVGYAQQEPFLFSTTVERNLSLALDDPRAPDARERLVEAARQAAVLGEVEAMEDGFDTVVGERGVQLSGGQKQRLALARALLNEPRVLVLDDPLSAVDADTEARILAALDRAKADRTVILITNRVAAASRADEVLVLDHGRVVERGTPEALEAAGGLYARLCRRQRLERELEEL
jgi:ATP-binding cassette subfamily B multidrug efflux pump